MTTPGDGGGDGRDPLDLLAEEFLRQRRRGGSTTVESFAAAHPEHGAQLRQILPAMLALEGLKRERESSGSQPRLPQVPALEQLDDYRIVREVGRGGMGVVFEAVQESLGRRVALKVLPSQALASERQLARFRREAQTAARLHHSNIVPVFGSGQCDGYHYFAMQFIEGRGLDQVVAELAAEPATASTDQRERARRAARIGAQAAAALQHAHEHGVLHRDIKPSNLLLDRDDNVWISDFGLAKALEAEGLTHSGDVLGTLQYMAPEQFQGQYDARSEVYALGLTLYELVVGAPGFRGTARGELVERITRGRLDRIERRAPGVPADLATVVHKAIAVEPDHRYASARELQEDLERFLADRPIRARRVSSVEHLWRFCRRNRALAVLGASTLVAVVAAAVLGWTFYGIADRAREQERVSALNEKEARSLVAVNLQIALAAFEDVFDALVGPDPFHAYASDPDTGEYEGMVYAAVSPRDAALLERMLSFYGRFAERNADDGSLREQTARAHRRVGTIRARLGDLDGATQAFQQALQLYLRVTGVDTRIDVALVHVEYGQVLLRQREPSAAVDRFRTALRLLESEPPDPGRRSRYERARAHFLLAEAVGPFRGGPGGRGPRPDGPRPDGQRPEGRPDGRRPEPPWGSREEVREHQVKARELLAGLQQEDPDNPELLLLEAKLLATEGRFGRRGAGEDPMRRAIEVMEGLALRFPSNDAYRYFLVELYGMRDPGRFGRRPGPDRPERGERPDRPELTAEHDARKAVEHAEQLVRLAPQCRDYLASLGRARSRLGALLLWQARSLGPDDAARRAACLDEARRELELGLEVDRRVATEDRSDPAALQVIASRTLLALVLVERREPELARQETEAVIAALKALPPGRLGEGGRGSGAGAVMLLPRLLEALGMSGRWDELRSELGLPERPR